MRSALTLILGLIVQTTHAQQGQNIPVSGLSEFLADGGLLRRATFVKFECEDVLDCYAYFTELCDSVQVLNNYCTYDQYGSIKLTDQEGSSTSPIGKEFLLFLKGETQQIGGGAVAEPLCIQSMIELPPQEELGAWAPYVSSSLKELLATGSVEQVGNKGYSAKFEVHGP